MINYYLMTKPGIILGNLVTVSAGFFLASRGSIDYVLLSLTLLGLALLMASACVFNNYLDQDIDQKMDRTKERPLVRKLITDRNALAFATALGLLGNLILWRYTNALTVAIASGGFFVYVVLYSLWKRRTIYSTAIGSIAGAVPPVVGYCAVSNRLDAAAVILFFMMVLWQMPHFYAIALRHLEDYKAANIPLLPIQKGSQRTKIHMTVYILCFITASAMLTFFHYTGMVYLYIALSAGLLWLGLCLKGFGVSDDALWAHSMFRLSLVVIGTISVAMSLPPITDH